MKVYVTDSAIYCSRECFANGGGDDRIAERIALPRRPANKVFDILLGRATCDTCGLNLEDLAVAQDNARVDGAKGKR